MNTASDAHQLPRAIAVLGTGGTIAGRAGSANDHTGYAAGALTVADIAQGLNCTPHRLICEDVAQIDSKDMTVAVWQRLLTRLLVHLRDPEIAGVVITHGTDTLEETAILLHLCAPAWRASGKPVVLTCAMRPATALVPDGPQNLQDALTVAAKWGCADVLVMCAGVVHAAAHAQKVHSYRLDAFSSAEAGPLAYVEEGRVRRISRFDDGAWWAGQPHLPRGGFDPQRLIDCALDNWPHVDVIFSGAAADARLADALLQVHLQASDTAASRHGSTHRQMAAGWVVAGTGNGTLHAALLPALARAQQQGIVVWCSSRCAFGHAISPHEAQYGIPMVALPPAKARVALMLKLLGDSTATG